MPDAPTSPAEAGRGGLFGAPLAGGVAWSMGGFAVLGVSALAINLLLGRFYEPWVLGVFNFTLAVFLLAGQLATFAIQASVLFHTPKALAEGGSGADVLTSGLLLSALVSAPVALTVSLASGWLATTFDNPAAADALGWAAIGLFVYPFNKILLASANGRRDLRLYALGVSGRALGMVAGVVVFVLAGLDGAWIGLTIAVADGLLFLALLAVHRPFLRRLRPGEWALWRRRHVDFGARGVAGVVLFELSTRVDTFALAFLADMDTVGVYSMASGFAEGLFQLLVVLRYSYDPLIARYVLERRHAELRALVRSGRRLAYLGMAALAAVAVVLYPWVVEVLVGRADYDPSWSVFAILAAGVALAAGYVPFSGFLQQSGHPGWQSALILGVIATNLVGKLVLFPAFGIDGAAVATAVSQVAFVLGLRALVRRRVGVSI